MTRFDREQGVGAQIGASDTSAQLVKLRQSEHIGAVDDQRIGIGYVQAGFDDVGRQKDVAAAPREGGDRVVQVVPGHLAMGTDDPEFGRQRFEPFRNEIEVGQPGTDIEALPATLAFPPQGLDDDLAVVSQHAGPDRLPFDRRGADQAKVAQAGQGQLKGAGIGVAVMVRTWTPSAISFRRSFA